jgi:hypothetical protein
MTRDLLRWACRQLKQFQCWHYWSIYRRRRDMRSRSIVYVPLTAILRASSLVNYLAADLRSGLILVINIGECSAVLVAHDKGVVEFFEGLGRRGSHIVWAILTALLCYR